MANHFWNLTTCLSRNATSVGTWPTLRSYGVCPARRASRLSADTITMTTVESFSRICGQVTLVSVPTACDEIIHRSDSVARTCELCLLALDVPITAADPFKWRHYPGDIILW